MFGVKTDVKHEQGFQTELLSKCVTLFSNFMTILFRFHNFLNEYEMKKSDTLPFEIFKAIIKLIR